MLKNKDAFLKEKNFAAVGTPYEKDWVKIGKDGTAEVLGDLV